MRVRLSDNQEVEGIVEFYDATFIRLTREGAPNLFLYKHDIKYLYELAHVLKSFVEIAAEIAREAGAVISEFARQRIGFELKGAYDLVTEADRASEQLIVERLRQHFPTHAIVAEEGGGKTVRPNIAGMSIRWTAPPISRTAFRCTT